MASQLDINLSNIYKNMVGLHNIESNFNESISINSNFYVSGITILNSSTTIKSSLNVSGFSICNNSTSINSSLNVSGLTNINNLFIS
jgi:hypothetical protein